jgi:hypothetical protein
MSKRKTNGKEVATTKPKHEPNAKEQLAIAAAEQSHAVRPARAQFTQEPDESGAMNLGPRHADLDGHNCLLTETFGTTAQDFVNANVLQLANVTMRNEKPSVEGLNASLALIGAIAPENELEAALASQMAATHELSMEMLRRTRMTDNREAMREYGNMATKLTRTFTTQMKALSEWRRGGEQVVRHVHVNEGGQAVVAETINIGGHQNGKELKQAHEQHQQGARGSEVLGYDPPGHEVPVSSDEGQEAVPAPRRKGDGRAKGKQERS